MKQKVINSIVESLYLLSALVATVLSMLVFLFGEPFYFWMPIIFGCGTYMFLSRYWKLRTSKKEGAWVVPLGILYFFLALVLGLLCVTSCITNWR